MTFNDCLEAFEYVSSQIPGQLVVVCEYESSSGAILELDRPEDATNVCPAEGEIVGRIVAVGLMPSP